MEVSRDLLGKVLVKQSEEGLFRALIVEVEAYTGESDPGSHAFRGRTPRNEVMFGPGGCLYVYFTYGMHYCMNVVTDKDAVAGAALLRALEPLEGLESMEARRGGRALNELCNGPAKLCEAFGITKKENGIDLTGDFIWIEDEGYPVKGIARTTRVGLSKGTDLRQRFYLPESHFVSRRKVSPRSRRQIKV